MSQAAISNTATVTKFGDKALKVGRDPHSEVIRVKRRRYKSEIC